MLCITRYYSSKIMEFVLEESLIYTSKEVGLEINVEKTKYMLLSRH
jgi:hypothetical protein